MVLRPRESFVLYMIDFKKKLQEAERLEKKEQGFGKLEILEEELAATSQKRKRLRIYVVSAIVIGLVFAGKILIASQSATNWLPEFGFLDKIRRLVPIAEKQLQGEEADRINILLLGMGGENHDGGYLTDTIMLASFKPSTKQVALISIPRDLTTPVSNWRKINSINAYAEQDEPGSGGQATAIAIGELLQEDVPYYIRVDFSGFERIINELGGIEINVENAFDDYTYPIKGREDNPDYYSRFEHLHFDTGWQKMDGETALKYARSRHALGSEGSDFARAKRQQLVLEAVKDKLLSAQTLLNPATLSKLIGEFNQDVSTNLNTWEMIKLFNLFKDTNRSQIINRVLSDAPDGLLVSGKGQDGAYILTPRSGNFSEIRNMVQGIFNSSDSGEPTEELTPEPLEEKASVFVANGTWISGLAGKSSEKLSSYNFNVVGTGNAIERNFQESVIYDLTGDTKKEALDALKQLSDGEQAFNAPSWLEEYKTGEKQADFLLILGTEAAE